MGVFHRATITPTKAELLAAWVPTQSWCPPGATTVEVVGAFRFDDPENRVGIETHLVTAADTVLQVPVTYRNEPLAGADQALITEMEHSALGTRWVYDALSDDRYLTMLAASAMTGQGEALGMVEHDGRWVVAPATVRIHGGGWTLDRVPVDDFTRIANDDSNVVFTNDGFELTVHRRPAVGPRPPLGLSATWEGQTDPVLLASVRER